MALIITDFPESPQGLAYGAELVTFLGSLQIACTQARRHRGDPPVIETDCKSIITRGIKEYSRFGQRSLNCRRHGYLYQYIRRVHTIWPRGIRLWVRSHPEPDARIAIADMYAGHDDPEQVTAKLHSAKFKSFQYEVTPEVVLTVTAQEILEATFSEGDYYWAEGSLQCPTSTPLQRRRERALRTVSWTSDCKPSSL